MNNKGFEALKETVLEIIEKKMNHPDYDSETITITVNRSYDRKEDNIEYNYHAQLFDGSIDIKGNAIKTHYGEERRNDGDLG